MSRLTQILRGKNVTPLTEKEAAVKFAVDNAAAGITGLPAVTAADNGKVLKVVDGAWAAATETPAQT